MLFKLDADRSCSIAPRDDVRSCKMVVKELVCLSESDWASFNIAGAGSASDTGEAITMIGNSAAEKSFRNCMMMMGNGTELELTLLEKAGI